MKTIPLYLLTLLAAVSAHATDFTCSGTEPFWGLQITGESLKYSSPESPRAVNLAIVSTTEAAGVPADLAKIIKTKFTSLTIVRGADCTDGMSEQTYTHHAVYEINGAVLYGCCNQK